MTPDVIRNVNTKQIILKSRLYIFILFSIFDVLLLIKYENDTAVLLSFAQKYIQIDDTPDVKVIKLAEAVCSELKMKGNSGSFVSPIFRFLRPTALQVAESGGDCADKSRLLITLLHLNDIEASKVALYDDSGISRHAVVEAKLQTEEMVVDAYYGLYFPKPGGGYYSVNDIKNNEQILHNRIDTLISQGVKLRRPPLEHYPYDRYTYRHPRSINWEKSYGMKILYIILSAIAGEEWTNTLERPYFVEQPALMLLYCLISVQLIIVISWIPLRRNKV